MTAGNALYSPSEGGLEPVSAYDLFFQYSVNKLGERRAAKEEDEDSDGERPSSSSSPSGNVVNEGLEAYKKDVRRYLDVTPVHDPTASHFKSVGERISLMWNLVDGKTRSVFVELARERLVHYKEEHPCETDLEDDEIIIHCPIVHRGGSPFCDTFNK